MTPEFRVWHPDAQEFEYLKLQSYDYGSFTGLIDKFGDDQAIWEPYTGLNDVNGNKIYEGDIIKSSYKYAQPKVSQIIIEDGNSYILGEDLATGNEMLVSDHISEIKVIGNVHTKHELVEGNK